MTPLQIRRMLIGEDADGRPAPAAAGLPVLIHHHGPRCHRVGDVCQGEVAHTVTPTHPLVKQKLCENRSKPELSGFHPQFPLASGPPPCLDTSMASNQDFTFRAGVALVAAFAFGVAGISLYSPGADISDRAFAGLLLGVSLLSLCYGVRVYWRGLTNRRRLRDRRRPIQGSFRNDRRLRNLGSPFGPDRRQGPNERRQQDRRSRFA